MRADRYYRYLSKVVPILAIALLSHKTEEANKLLSVHPQYPSVKSLGKNELAHKKMKFFFFSFLFSSSSFTSIYKSPGYDRP